MASEVNIETYHVTLVGPDRPTNRTKSEVDSSWRRVVIEFEVGGNDCPDHQSFKICLNAVEDLIKMSEGSLSDAVVNALRSHVRVVECVSF